ncbi:MAG: DNA-directed RNA polymerase subunit omega [Chloroflexi bacterium]|nr:DNA-directed RNA polymerase subunit omega [Chloroflexota bacterium]
MNSEYCKKAAEKVGNPNILVNLISRRVRQLTTGGGGSSGGRPLLSETAGMGAADIALVEIIEGKMGWDILDENPLAELPVKKRRRA